MLRDRNDGADRAAGQVWIVCTKAAATLRSQFAWSCVELTLAKNVLGVSVGYRPPRDTLHCACTMPIKTTAGRREVIERCIVRSELFSWFGENL